jgi:APA family basic amino acid/polyamine antiporter
MGLLSRKSFQDLAELAEEKQPKLRRYLGPVNLIMLGIGCIIGAGLFSITGIAAAQNAGPAIILSFIIAAIGCSFASLCYSELASMIPVAGSTYTYAYATMGEFIAWIIGWDLILEYAIGAAAVSISWSSYIVSLLQDFGIHLPSAIAASPWQPIMHDGMPTYGIINLPAMLIIVVISIIIMLGIRQSALTNAIMVIVKVSVAVIFIIVGFFFIQADNYHPFLPENTGTFGEFGWSGVMRAAGIVFFAYIGFDAVSTVAQETKNPQKTLPIGIIGSLAICTILYILFSFVMVGLVNYKELNVAAPVALAIDQTSFPWLKWLVKLAILTGLTSVILVLLLGQSRIFYAMSSDGLLPPLFSRIHPKFRTPWISNLILMSFAGIFASFASLEMMGQMTSIGTLLAFVIVCLGVLTLRYQEPHLPRPFKTPWVPFVPVMGIFVCLLMMVSLGIATWVRLIIWLAIGLIIYFYYGRHRTGLKMTSPPS